MPPGHTLASRRATATAPAAGETKTGIQGRRADLQVSHQHTSASVSGHAALFGHSVNPLLNIPFSRTDFAIRSVRFCCTDCLKLTA